MTPTRRIAIVGNYLPRRCGIATFTHDLRAAITGARPDLQMSVLAMNDAGCSYDYPAVVTCQIRDDQVGDYIDCAALLNDAQIDVVSLQHEYGIFGGEAGGYVVQLLSRLRMPVVTTLHTVLPEPSSEQRTVMRQIIEHSERLIVMSNKGRQILQSVHDVPERKIDIIPHGIPDFPLRGSQDAKVKFGFSGRPVILTFGLLSPGKGIETVIDAMPGILRSCPNAVYVVLGATHPHLLQQQGEIYREALEARTKTLGIEDNVVFINQFVDQPTLLDYISMCDVYVTPYLNEAQMTSGTLAYSFGLGKAVVSTPYWHAKELLADGRGILVPFSDVQAMSSQIAGLLTDHERRLAIGKRAYASSRTMIWPQTAVRYVQSFEKAREPIELPIVMPVDRRLHVVTEKLPLPEVRTHHFLSLCDDVGMLQHAVFSIADRSHGYCVDDNARALLFASALADSTEEHLPDVLTARFAAFVQHAWNPDTRRFRNFMGYDRRWLEETGSEDSHGRTLWALAECSSRDTDLSRQKWSAALFKTALPVVGEFSSPRAWAFTLLGLDTYCKLHVADRAADELRRALAERLLAMMLATETKDWVWFEDLLAYDNARLSQAMIQTGLTMKCQAYLDVGLRSLRWLIKLQTSTTGCFSPVGTTSFGKLRARPGAFDQQPVEAAAMVSACYAASTADPSPDWVIGAQQAFDWFHGRNVLGLNLINSETGGCADGLHPDRANANQGAESTLSYLLALVEVRKHERIVAKDQIRGTTIPARRIDQRTITPRTTSGGPLVSIPISKPAEPISAARSGQSRRQTI